MKSISSKSLASNHLVWADVLRIFSISLVVLLHTFKLPTGNGIAESSSFLLITLASTAVPLFVMISGALLLPKKEAASTFFNKRIQRIIRPWLFWALVLFIITNGINFPAPLESLRTYTEILSAKFTFIPMIFCLYLLVPTFRIIVKEGGKRHVAYLVSLWFLAVSFVPYLRNTMAFPISVDNGLVRQTIYYSGYMLTGWLLTKIKLTKKTFVLTSFTTIATILWTFALVQSSQDTNSIFMSYFAPLIVISSMSVFLLFQYFEKYFVKMSQKLKSILAVLAKASFGVFLIHGVILEIEKIIFHPNLIGLLQGNIAHWTIITATSFLIILFLMKFRILKKLVT